jgi:hypothetical protein
VTEVAKRYGSKAEAFRSATAGLPEGVSHEERMDALTRRLAEQFSDPKRLAKLQRALEAAAETLREKK